VLAERVRERIEDGITSARRTICEVRRSVQRLEPLTYRASRKWYYGE